LSGNFKDGLLHGPNGFWQNVAEDIYTGMHIHTVCVYVCMGNI
jgi:hypothetical protein